MGVWIETSESISMDIEIAVAPLVGVWIETVTKVKTGIGLRSLPSWECGLKHLEVETNQS